MDDTKQVFTGKSGKLIVGRDGITIERNFAQATQERTKRVTHLNFNDIESLGHRYAADKPGYIELKAKAGGEAGSMLNRRHRIHFDAASSHRFRRAQKQISRKIEEQLALGSTQEGAIAGQDSESHYQPAPIHHPGSVVFTDQEATTSAEKNAAPVPPPLIANIEGNDKPGLPFRLPNSIQS